MKTYNCTVISRTDPLNKLSNFSVKDSFLDTFIDMCLDNGCLISIDDFFD